MVVFFLLLLFFASDYWRKSPSLWNGSFLAMGTDGHTSDMAFEDKQYGILASPDGLDMILRTYVGFLIF